MVEINTLRTITGIETASWCFFEWKENYSYEPLGLAQNLSIVLTEKLPQ
jgi:hypothetical protein